MSHEAHRLIKYIKDDRFIASYLGGEAECWTPARVARLRKLAPPGQRRSNAYLPPSSGDGAIGGHGSNQNAHTDAINGSRKLLAALLKFYEGRAA